MIHIPEAPAQTPGTKRWEFATEGKISSTPAIGADGTIYFGSFDKRLYALDDATGQQRWIYLAADEIHSSPVLDEENRVFATTRAGLIVAVSADQGACLWTYQMAAGDNSGPISCALGPGPLLYAACKPGFVYALNRTNGVEVWSVQLPGRIGNSPSVSQDGTVIIGCDDYRLYGLKGFTGQQRWHFPTDGEVRVSPALDSFGTAYFFACSGPLYAIDALTGLPKWKSTTVSSQQSSSPVMGENGWIYSGTLENKAEAIDPQTRQLRWQAPLGGEVMTSSPAVGDDGVVYIGCRDRKVYAFDGRTGGKKQWEFLTGGEVNSSPAIGATGVIYIGSDDGKLYALNASSRGLAKSSWPKYRNNARQTGAMPFQPVFASQPRDTTVKTGHTLQLSVDAYGETPLSFQWFKDHQPLSGETSPRLNILNASEVHSGLYYVVVSNRVAMAGSTPAFIRVTDHIPPETVLLSPTDGSKDVLPDTPILAKLRSRETAVDAMSIRFWVNGQEVSTQLALDCSPEGVLIRYQPSWLDRNQIYDLILVFSDIHPSPLSQTNRWRFTSIDAPIVSADRRIFLDTASAKRGFNVRSAQLADGMTISDTLEDAEKVLADPPGFPIAYRGQTILPVLNLTKINSETHGVFDAEDEHPNSLWTSVSLESGLGPFAIEAVGFMELPKGLHRFGTISDDGFEFSLSPTSDQQSKLVLGRSMGIADGERQFEVYVSEAGLYPFRFVYWEWGDYSYLEFFSVDRTTRQKTLINDSRSIAALKVYYLDSPLAQPQNLNTLEDTPLNIQLAGTLPNGGLPLYNVTQQPTLGILNGFAPNLVYTPNEDVSGLDSFSFTVADPFGNIAEAQVNISIQAVNDSPLIMPIANQTAQADTPIGPLLIRVQDVDTPLAQITVDVTADNLALIPASNLRLRNSSEPGEWQLELVAAPDLAGGTDIRVAADDHQGGLSSTLFHVTFTPVPPSFLIPLLDQTVHLGDPLVMTVQAAGTPPLTFEWSLDGSLLPSATGTVLSHPSFQAADAGRYSVTVRNTAGEAATIGIVSVANEPPQIITQPASASIVANESATFCVSATGTEPLFYQWQFNGRNLNGATNTSLLLTQVQSGQAGNYSVIVSNRAGSVTSFPASLTVFLPSQIIHHPVNQVALPCSNVVFKVEAVGSPPLAFQWHFNGHNLPDETNDTISLSAVTATNSGEYSVTVSNPYGSVPSLAANLEVVAFPPVQISSPLNGSKFLANTNLSVQVIPGSPADLVTTIELYAGSTRMGELPGPDYSLVWPNVPAGDFTLTAIARGNCGLSSTSAPVQIIILAPNVPPSFTIGTDPAIEDTAGSQILENWASNISPGPAKEADQSVSFDVTSEQSHLFAVLPAISPAGTLTFTPAQGNSGVATVTAWLKDNGGTADGGIDTSPPQTFTITITHLNRPPTISEVADQTIPEDTVTSAILFTINDSETAAEDLLVSATSSNQILVPDANLALSGSSANRSLVARPAPDQFGETTVTLVVRDGGSLAATNRFKLIVLPINDPPSFTKGVSSTAENTAGLQTLAGWARNLSVGPNNEASQILNFTVSNDRPTLFATQPSIDANGTLTFTPARGTNGVATLTVQAKDNGGTMDGGIDTSPSQTFTITITQAIPLPSLRLTKPKENDVFLEGSDIFIVAEALGGKEPPLRVEIFTDTVLRKSALFPPYSFAWADSAGGAHTILAKAIYGDGTTLTDSLRVSVQQVDALKDVAVIYNQDDPVELPQILASLEEINALRPMGLTYDLMHLDTVSLSKLLQYHAIVWDDIANKGLTEFQADLFQRLFAAGRSLYFIGDRLAETHYVDGAGMNDWGDLIHLRPASGSGGNDMVDIAPHSITVNLSVGGVSAFAYPSHGYAARRTGLPGEWVIGSSGDTDLLVAYKEPVSKQRTFTQHLRIVSGHDAVSLAQRERLFRNVICWLVPQGCHCTDPNLRPMIEMQPERAEVGNEMRIDVIFSNNGACAGTAVTITDFLPDGFRVVRVEPDDVSWRTEFGVLICELQQVAERSEKTVSLTLVPLRQGLYTNVIEIQADQIYEPIRNSYEIQVACVTSLCQVDPPLILQHPYSQTVKTGEKAIFQITARGTSPLHYQWQFQGQYLPGATNPVLIVPNASWQVAGAYAVRVSNLAGSVVSQTALLTIQEISAPVLSISRINAATLRIELRGLPNHTYVTEFTEDLKLWRPAQTNASTTDLIEWTEAKSGLSKRYYRSKVAP